jgi:hypothetical protein
LRRRSEEEGRGPRRAAAHVLKKWRRMEKKKGERRKEG